MVDSQGTASVPAKTRRDARRSQWGLTDAAAGVLAAVGLALAWGALSRVVVIPAELQVLGASLAVWIPLAGAVLIASFLRGHRSLRRDFGLQFGWLDLLWGVGVGLSARAVTTFIELAAGRSSSLDGPLLVESGWFALWFGVVLASLLVSPLVEETFFRGLTLRAVERATAGSRRVAASVAVVVSALVFALLHVVIAPPMPLGAAAVGFAGVLLLGLGAGALTALTGRLGGAIIAHVVYNGVVVAVVVAAQLR